MALDPGRADDHVQKLSTVAEDPDACSRGGPCGPALQFCIACYSVEYRCLFCHGMAALQSDIVFRKRPDSN